MMFITSRLLTIGESSQAITQSKRWPSGGVGLFMSCLKQRSFSNDLNWHTSLLCLFSKWPLMSPTTIISLPSLSKWRKSGNWSQKHFACSLVLFAVMRAVHTKWSWWNIAVHDSRLKCLKSPNGWQFYNKVLLQRPFLWEMLDQLHVHISEEMTSVHNQLVSSQLSVFHHPALSATFQWVAKWQCHGLWVDRSVQMLCYQTTDRVWVRKLWEQVISRQKSITHNQVRVRRNSTCLLTAKRRVPLPEIWSEEVVLMAGTDEKVLEHFWKTELPQILISIFHGSFLPPLLNLWGRL